MYRGVIAFIGLQLVALADRGDLPAARELPAEPSLLSLRDRPAAAQPHPAATVSRSTSPNGSQAPVKASHGGSRTPVRSTTGASRRTFAEELAEGSRAGRGGDSPSSRRPPLAAGAVAEAAPAYRPVHTVVRDIEADIRAIDGAQIERAADRAVTAARRRRRGGTRTADARSIEELELRKSKELAATLPAEWEETRATFAELKPGGEPGAAAVPTRRRRRLRAVRRDRRDAELRHRRLRRPASR